MASPVYTKLVALVGEYVGAEKAASVIERQLKHCAPATADSFTVADLQKIRTFVTTATSLYVTDKAKKDELVAKIQGIA